MFANIGEDFAIVLILLTIFSGSINKTHTSHIHLEKLGWSQLLTIY